MIESKSMPSISCISDRPVTIEADMLGNNRYSLGLLGFIREADTPVTIGIQGGWGSGKTSLINILQHQLEQQGDTLCVFINAWEHSLFQNQDNKSGVAVSLLSGVVESICRVVETKAKLPASDASRIFEEVKAEALNEDSISQKAGKVAVGLLSHAARLGAKLMADIDMPGSGEVRPQVANQLGARFIQDLRRDLTHAVKVVTEKSIYKRFVCFVDDLDRVRPTTAVEILDVLKNVFDIPSCVFVLAIDYDVVVKGLADKYKEKTPENEREFRQYFDKIIQVPFAMPVGAYSDKMEKLLSNHFSSLNLQIPNLKRMTDVALLATDGIPRGVKRIVNTLSLLIRIREGSDDGMQKAALPAEHLETLFIVVALQINFPEIYRRLAEKPKFSEWNVSDLHGRWDLLIDIEEDLIDNKGVFDPSPLSNRHGEYFDDNWEHVVYLLCQKNIWLKQKAVTVSRILNILLEVQQNCDGEVGTEYLQDALNAVNVTNIDGREQVVELGEGPKNDKVTHFCREVHQKLAAVLAPKGFTVEPVDYSRNWAKKWGGGKRRTYAEIALGRDCFGVWSLALDAKVSASIRLAPPRGKTTEFRKYVFSNLPNKVSNDYGDEYSIDLADYGAISDLTDDATAYVVTLVADFVISMQEVVDGFKR